MDIASALNPSPCVATAASPEPASDRSYRADGTDVAHRATENDTGFAISSAGTSSVPDHAQSVSHAGSISSHSHDFLNKVKARFGEHSNESTAIHDVLVAFRQGHSPKRQAFSTIMSILGHDSDLKQELMERILYHDDARWAPGDFDFADTHPAPQTSPEFLQPQHQPQLPIPMNSSAWFPASYGDQNQQLAHGIDPAVLRASMSLQTPDRAAFTSQPYQQQLQAQDMSHSGLAEYEDTRAYQAASNQNRYYSYSNPFVQNVPSSPVSQFLPQDQGLGQRHSTYADTGHTARLSSPILESDRQTASLPMAPIWGNTQTGSMWTQNDNGHMVAPTNLLMGNQATASQSLSGQQSIPHIATPRLGSSNVTPSLLGTPMAVPIGRPALDLIPPARRKRSDTQVHAEQKDKGEAGSKAGASAGHSTNMLGNTLSVPRPFKIEPEPKPKTQRAARVEGQYVHLLCGKSFSTRYGVKKHHWGTKPDDLNTTTGCWAKHGKPAGVKWDDHPSCKDDANSKHHSKHDASLLKPDMAQVYLQEFRAPVPDMIPKPQDTLPGFPTLDDLPRTVARALQSPRESYPPLNVDILSKDSSSPGLSSYPPLDTLLTAVNVASRIDAPMPQGRNDSVVSQLDARVAATENGHGHSSFPHVGLGITGAEELEPVPAGAILRSQMHTSETAAYSKETQTLAPGFSHGDQVTNALKRARPAPGFSHSDQVTNALKCAQPVPGMLASPEPESQPEPEQEMKKQRLEA